MYANIALINLANRVMMDLLKVKVNCTELFRYSSQLRGHSNMRPPGPKSSPSSEVSVQRSHVQRCTLSLSKCT